MQLDAGVETKDHAHINEHISISEKELPADVFDVTSEQGAAILGVSSQAFRKRLSRARERIQDYLTRNCALINPKNPCKCERFLAPYLDDEMSENRLVFAQRPCRIRHEESSFKYIREMDELNRIAFLYKRYPDFQTPVDLIENIRDLLKSKNMSCSKWAERRRTWKK
jgi:predicted DNA-binding protein (UPF0251 family)